MLTRTLSGDFISATPRVSMRNDQRHHRRFSMLTLAIALILTRMGCA
jgi:hypothetical protein